MTNLKQFTAVGGVAALGAVLAVLSAFAARAADADDSKFLRDAIQTDIAEVKLSELALQRSNDNGVRELAARLQADHSTAMQQTAAVATTLGVTPPAGATPDAQEHYASLSKLSGPEFDAAFVSHMVAAHRAAIGKFGEQTHANPNAAIAGLVARLLPTLEQHLASAESLLAARDENPSADAHAAPAHAELQAGPGEPAQSRRHRP
jgi:putative membrane protein